MNYSTLQEAYNIDSFKKIKNKKKLKYDDEDDRSENLEKNMYDIEYAEKRSNKVRKEIYDINTNKEDNKENISSKHDIEPYYDEDLEKYLNINDFESNTITSENKSSEKTNEKRIIANDVNDVNNDNKNIKGSPENVNISNQYNDIFYKNFINIGLFILVGILIIFLCDQITEIAISIGMKKTFQILEPYCNIHNKQI